MAKIISITSSKGGSGKTTLTAIASAMLVNDYNKKVAVIDFDPQKSLMKIYNEGVKRIKDKERAYMDQAIRNKSNAGIYHAHAIYIDLDSDYASISKKINSVVEHFDYVFIDLPGSLLINDNALRILELIDYIFVPLYVDKNNYESTMEFFNALKAKKGSGSIKAEFFLFFNKYSKVKNTAVFKEVRKFFDKKNIPLLDSVIYNYISMEQYSIILSPKYKGANTPEYLWMEELNSIIN